MSDNRQERLQQRAYEIWESEGRPNGRDREHWEQAEREVTGDRAAGPDGAIFDTVSKISASPTGSSSRRTTRKPLGSDVRRRKKLPASNT